MAQRPETEAETPFRPEPAPFPEWQAHAANSQSGSGIAEVARWLVLKELDGLSRNSEVYDAIF
jgi:hypothetical protein